MTDEIRDVVLEARIIDADRGATHPSPERSRTNGAHHRRRGWWQDPPEIRLERWIGRWVAPRRPPEWALTMLEYPMILMPTCEELLQRFGPVEDPEIEARRQQMLGGLLDQDAKTRQQLIDTGVLEGQLTATRVSMRRVLARRQLTPNKDDSARIDACTDLATLERWLDQAITAFSASDVLA